MPRAPEQTPLIANLYARLIHRGARVMVGLGLHANQITLLALATGLGACALYAFNGQRVAFAALLLAGGYLDTLDGAVARMRNEVTRTGGYLDAICDRVFDAAVLFTLAAGSEHWALCMLVAMASYSVSYAKARAALEAPASNLGWPHVMGREERVITLVLTVALWGAAPGFRLWGADVLQIGLLVMLAGLVITTGQRVAFAFRLLGKPDRAAVPAS